MPTMNNVKRGSSVVVFCSFAAALLIVSAPAQESSVILKNIDALEKRVLKLEGDVGRLRKTPAPAAASPISARGDSTLGPRLDSLSARLKALEADRKKDATVRRDAPADTSEIASLVK